MDLWPSLHGLCILDAEEQSQHNPRSFEMGALDLVKRVMPPKGFKAPVKGLAWAVSLFNRNGFGAKRVLAWYDGSLDPQHRIQRCFLENNMG